MKSIWIKNRFYINITIILVTLTSIFFIVETFITRYIIQMASDKKTMSSNTIIILFLLMSLSYLLYFLKLRSDNYSSYRIKKDLNELYWNSIYQSKIKDFDLKKVTGDSTAYFTQKVGFLINEYFGEIYELLFNSTFVILGTVYIIFNNFTVALASVIFYIITIFISKYFSKKNRIYIEKINQSYSKLIVNMDEFVKNANQIRCYNAFGPAKKIYSHEKNIYVENIRKYEMAKLLFNTLNDVLTRYRELAVLILVIFSGKTMEIANLFMLLYLSSMLSVPFVRFSEHVNSILSTKSIRDEIEDFELIKKSKTICEKLNSIENINIKKLSIKKGGKQIIKDFSRNLSKRKKYMLHGNSGAGKTTIAKSILGFEDIEGKIMVNGSILADEEQLYGLYSFISSNDNLFDDTVKNNITLFSRNPDEEKYIEIVKKLSLKLSSNYLIENEELNVSGGEKQKILLARALYIEYDLIVIDEALAAIDKTSADIIVKNILEMDKSMILFIDHNIDKELIKAFDEVIYV